MDQGGYECVIFLLDMVVFFFDHSDDYLFSYFDEYVMSFYVIAVDSASAFGEYG